MSFFGQGIVKGMATTLRHFVTTFVEDLKIFPLRWGTEVVKRRQDPTSKGIVTLQYPEEQRPLPERFRHLPVLLYDTETGLDLCTSCGICAKVCPPQCIWIEQEKDENGKTIPVPKEFIIDTSICMSCGYCAEFCPFDAIKMNHMYELATFERWENWIHDHQDLLISTDYYKQEWPTTSVGEKLERKKIR